MTQPIQTLLAEMREAAEVWQKAGEVPKNTELAKWIETVTSENILRLLSYVEAITASRDHWRMANMKADGFLYEYQIREQALLKERDFYKSWCEKLLWDNGFYIQAKKGRGL